MATTPFDEAAYQNQFRSINSAYSSGLQGVNEQRRMFQSQMPYVQQQFDRSWQQAAARVPDGLGRRGLLNSGVYRRALQNFGSDRNDAAFQLQSWAANQQAGFENAQQQLVSQRDLAKAALLADRQARRTQTAALLRQLANGN